MLIRCCEDWHLYFFLTGKWKGRRPQPADNRSVFRGLSFSFKWIWSCSLPTHLEPMWSTESLRLFVVMMRYLYTLPYINLPTSTGKYLCPFKRILSARRRPTVLPTSRMLSSFCCPSWKSPTSSRGNSPPSSEELTSDLTFTTTSRLRRLLRVSSGSNVCASSTSTVCSLFPHQQFLLSVWFLPRKPLWKDIQMWFFFSLRKQAGMIKYLFPWNLVLRKWCCRLQHIPVPAAIMFPLFYYDSLFCHVLITFVVTVFQKSTTSCRYLWIR